MCYPFHVHLVLFDMLGKRLVVVLAQRILFKAEVLIGVRHQPVD